MAITIEAIYENGVLRPATPLPFKEHEQLQVTIQPRTSWAERTAGLLHWPGDAATLDQFISASELDPQESS